MQIVNRRALRSTTASTVASAKARAATAAKRAAIARTAALRTRLPRANAATVTGAKYAEGAALSGDEFLFGIYDSLGDLIATTTNASDGSVIFPEMIYDTDGVYEYTVREISDSGDGWTVDPTVYPVQVTVTSDGTGGYDAVVSYPNGTPVWVNTYVAPIPATAVLTATKTVNGASIAADLFTFSVTEPSGTVIATATNDANGVVTFPALTLSAPGIYNYTITESTPSGNGWTTDTTSYPVVVTVTDDGTGTLTAEVSYPNGTPSFVNTYSSGSSNNCCCTPCCYRIFYCCR